MNWGTTRQLYKPGLTTASPMKARLVVEEFVEIREVQVVCVHSADGAKDGGEGLLTFLEDQQVPQEIREGAPEKIAVYLLVN